MKQIHIKLSESLHRELKIQAVIKGQTLQAYVVDALEEKIRLEKSPNHFTAEEGNGYNAESKRKIN